MNNGADSDTSGQSPGVLTFPQQMSLFEDTSSGGGPDIALTAIPRRHPTRRPAEAVQSAAMAVPDGDSEMACRTIGHPNMWTDEKFYPDLAPICTTCPFRQWCAGKALELSQEYHLMGMWAGVDFSETDKSGRYRRRIEKLEYIAETGRSPRTRRNKKPEAA